MTDATQLAEAIHAARDGLGWVSVAVLERGDDDEATAIERVAGALGITEPIGWRGISIEPSGRRLVTYAVGRSLAYGVQVVPLAEAEGFVDLLLRLVPGATMAVANTSGVDEVHGLGSYFSLSGRTIGVALILVGPTHAGGIAIEEDD